MWTRRVPVVHPGMRYLADPTQEALPHVRLLTRRRLEYDLACAGCDAAGQPVELVQVCEGCVQRCAEDAEDGSRTAGRGQPGIEERPEPLNPTIRPWPLPDDLREVIDLVPLSAAGAPPGWSSPPTGTSRPSSRMRTSKPY